METLQRTANRGSLSTGYDIDNSVKTEAGNNEWFYRSSPTASSTQTKFTFSFWHKRTQITGYPADPYLMSQGSNARFHITGNANPTLRFMFDGNSTELESSPRIRDTSAWYHIVLAVDTTQATASNRVKLYVNGEQISWDNSAYPSQNATSTWMSTTNMYFNNYNGDGAYDASGYYAEVCVIDGQQLDPTDFGEFDSASAIWKPKDVSNLTFGNEGFYLDFKDSSDLGADVSGNNNDCTLNNISAVDQATDTPTNNFCILNSNFIAYYYKAPTHGGTYIPMNGVNQYAGYTGTFGLTKGKWYYETYVDMRDSTYGLTVLAGIHTLQGNYQANNFMVDNTNQNSTAAYYMEGGHYYSWDSGARVVDSSLGGVGSSNVGQFVGIALNLDDNQISFYLNGSAVTNGTNLALNDAGDETDAGTFALPAFSVYTNNHTVNFGGYTKAPISSPQSDANGYGTFEHAPPSGYYAICSKNLAEYG